MRFPILAALALSSTTALACPGKTATAAASTDETSVASLDATACAKKASLVGSSCSYSTGMMASRVLEQGKSFSFTGRLQAEEEKLESNVAAPFAIGADGYRVIANEVLESVADTEARLLWKGKVLEVDGITYFVVTDFEKAQA